jgi:uncharacterized repeat protein (TIGR01451 family)
MSLAPHSLVIFGVHFAPVAGGSRSASISIGHTGFASPHTVSLNGNGRLPADIMVSQTVTVSGRRLAYSMTVRNNGPGAATTVDLEDYLPYPTDYVSAGPGCAYKGILQKVIVCTISDLASGSQRVIGLVVDVAGDKPVALTNAPAVYANVPDSDYKNNSSTLLTNWVPPQK